MDEFELLPLVHRQDIENPEGRVVGALRITFDGTITEPDQIVPNFDGSLDLYVVVVLRVRRNGTSENRSVDVVAHPPGSCDGLPRAEVPVLGTEWGKRR